MYYYISFDGENQDVKRGRLWMQIYGIIAIGRQSFGKASGGKFSEIKSF
jgi:hypothetical protein